MRHLQWRDEGVKVAAWDFLARAAFFRFTRPIDFMRGTRKRSEGEALQSERIHRAKCLFKNRNLNVITARYRHSMVLIFKTQLGVALGSTLVVDQHIALCKT